jgi:hypothetical protein
MAEEEEDAASGESSEASDSSDGDGTTTTSGETGTLDSDSVGGSEASSNGSDSVGGSEASSNGSAASFEGSLADTPLLPPIPLDLSGALDVKTLVWHAYSFARRKDRVDRLIAQKLKRNDYLGARSINMYFTCGCNGVLHDKLRTAQMSFGGEKLWSAQTARVNVLTLGAMMGFPVPDSKQVSARIPGRLVKNVTCAQFPLRESLGKLLLSLPKDSLLQASSLNGAPAASPGEEHGHPMQSPHFCMRAREIFSYVEGTPLWGDITAAASELGSATLFFPLFLSRGDDSAPVGTSMKRSVEFFITALINVCSSVTRTEKSSFYHGKSPYAQLYLTLSKPPP